MKHTFLYLVLFCAISFAGNNVLRATSVLSYHGDSASSGVNLTETKITPANLTVAGFSKQYSTLVDGQIYAQPLYVPSLVVTSGPHSGTHNLAIVATQHDSLYAIDSDSGQIIWQTSFLSTGLTGATAITSMPSSETGSTDTAPEIGICGTPIIDPSTNILYVAAKTKQILNGDTAHPNYVYTLYKIDITNGNATPNANILSSFVIAVTIYDGANYTYRTNADPTVAQDPFVPGTGDGSIIVNGQNRVYFNAMRAMNRPGLTIFGNSLYVAFGSHGDNGPYHGWLLAFNKNSLAITGVLNLTPNGGLGGVWGGGGKPVLDANGNIFLMTGNGSFDGYNNSGTVAGLDPLGFPVNGDYGDSFVKIAPDTTTSVSNQNKNGWGLRVVDYFSPFNNYSLLVSDSDLGSGGINLLPDSAGNVTHPHLLVGAGKQGNVYLIDRDSMGKFNATTDNVVQSQVAIGSSFNTPAFYNGVLYYVGANDNGKAFTVSNAALSTTPIKTPDAFSWPGSTPAISANGTANGIVWTLERSTSQLRAYSADNFNTELWTSALAPANRDQLGTVAKFTTPIVADGRVLVGTVNALVVYGPPTPPTASPAAPASLVATDISSLEIDLSWTDNATNEAGFAIEQSTDGINFTQIATVGVNVTYFPVVTNLRSGTTYYYRVRAYNSYQTQSYSAYTNVASATTASAGQQTLNYSSGFSGSTTTLQFNGTAALVNNRAELTYGGQFQAGAVWTSTPQNIQSFSTQFTFQLVNPVGDGMTFAIQNNNPGALGASAGGLGYQNIANSIAIKFDLYDNAGEGPNSTGLYINGASPTVPNYKDLTPSGIDLHSGDTMLVVLTYDGTTLTEKITDTTTAATATFTYPINIATTIGSTTAYVGFTGGTGGATATEDILTWSYSTLPTVAPAAPSNLVGTAASGTQVNLTWTDNSNNESGFLIQRKAGATGTYSQVAVVGANQTTYSDTALTPNTTYFYQVQATNNIGNSALSNEVSVTLPIPPLTPTGAQAVGITSTSISMTWINNATNATAYNIFRKITTATNFSQIASLPATATSYTDNNLAPGTTYDYHIQAYNIAGYSDFSGFTATTLANQTLPIVTASTTGGVAVNGIATGQITFTRNSPYTAALPLTYSVSGTAVSGTDYTALPGTITIPAGSASISVPVTSTPNGTSNSTVIASIASTATYTAGSPASATVVIENSTFNPTAQTAYGTSAVAGTTGGSVTLTFQGLPGSPSGVCYVWYLNGVAFSTTTAGTYTITNAIPSQSGTYSVYAYAPGGATGSASYTVTITNPPIVITPSVTTLSVNDGSSASFAVSLATAPIANVTVNVAISGTPALTVSPATLTFTPQSYQNQTVTVSAAAINSNDSNRSATVTLTAGTSTASVTATDVISDTQTASNLTGTAYPLTGSNIGTGSAGGSSVHASGNWWVDGSGTGGLSGSSDSFHFESQSLAGNFQMVVRLQNLVTTGGITPRAGLMIRDGTTAGSNFIALAGTAATSGGYALISRTTANTAAAETITSGTNLTYTYPAAWMMLTRVGNVLHAFVSGNGTSYTEVTNPTTGITWAGIGSAVNIGVFSSSGNTTNARAVMSNFSITTTSLPALTDQDIGSPTLPGSASVNAGVYSVTGSGADIWGTSDQFNFESQTVTGNNTIIARVNSVQNTDFWAKAGIMFRNSTLPGSAYFMISQNPSNEVEVQYRSTDNASTSNTSRVGGTTSPKWIKLAKVGNVISGYYATTTTPPASTDWTFVASQTISFTNTNYLAGMAVTAHNGGLLNTSVFSQYSLQNFPTQPLGLTDADIGNPSPAGGGALNNGVYTVGGGGSDIWGSADQFHYCYQSNNADKTIIVHVDSMQFTSSWAKAGIMFRNSTAAGAAYVGLYENPNLNVELQWRDADNASSATGSQVGNTTNAKWLKLVKSGNSFTGYYATTTTTPAASDWVLVATHNTTFTNSSYLGGLAVTSHNNGTLNSSVFSGYSQQ